MKATEGRARSLRVEIDLYLGDEFKSELEGSCRTQELLLLDRSSIVLGFPMDLGSRKFRAQCWTPAVTSCFSLFCPYASIAPFLSLSWEPFFGLLVPLANERRK